MLCDKHIFPILSQKNPSEDKDNKKDFKGACK